MLSFMADAQTLRITNYKDGVPMAGVRDSVKLSDGRWAVLTSGIDGVCEITPQGWITGVKEIASQAPLNVKIYPRNTLVSGSLGIILELPKRGEVNLAGYTITGQRLFEFSGIYDAGIWEFSKETSHWAQQPIFIRAVFGDYTVSTKAIIMRSGLQNEPKVSDNGVTRIGDVSRVTRQIGLSKPNDLTATIYAVGDHLYLPWDSTTISLTGDITLASVNGESGKVITVILYDALNFDRPDSTLTNIPITAGNKTRITDNKGQATIMLPDTTTIIPFNMTDPDYWNANNYKWLPRGDTTVALTAIRKTPRTGYLNIDENWMIFADTASHRYWGGVNYSSASWISDTLNLYLTYVDSLNNERALVPNNIDNPKEGAFDRIVKQQLELVNNSVRTVNRRFGFFKHVNYIYDANYGKYNQEAYEWYGWGVVRLNDNMLVHFANVGNSTDLSTMTVKNFDINMNAKRDTTDFYGLSKELLKGMSGTYDSDMINGQLVGLWNSIWTSNANSNTWYMQQPIDQALARFFNSAYDGTLTGCGFGNSNTEKWTTGYIGIPITDKDLKKNRP
jgi:hypothetical protein